MVQLILKDNTEIEFPNEAIKLCGYLERMLEDISDHEESIPVLESLCTKEVMEQINILSQLFINNDTKEIEKILSNSSDTLLFNLMNVSNFLEFTKLLNTLCLYFAEEIKKCKTPEQIRARFNVTTEFSSEEEKEARDEFAWHE